MNGDPDCPNCGKALKYDRGLDEEYCPDCGWSESVEEESEE